MSGFEIAGVVLAVFPIVIKAIEDYERNLNPLATLLYPSKYRGELRHLERRLWIQRDLFDLSLTRLLSPKLKTSELDSLLVHPDGPAWHDAVLVTKVQSHLQSNHSGCLIVIEDMCTTVKEMRDALHGSRVHTRESSPTNHKIISAQMHLYRSRASIRRIAALS